MIALLYRRIIFVIIIMIIITATSKIWSSMCTKAALRLYYGSKSKWDKIYIVTDLKEHGNTLSFITSSLYEALDSPTTVITLTPYECRFNECTPDLLLSYDVDKIEEASQRYPISKFSHTTLAYMSISNSMINDNHNIIGTKIWRKMVYFAIPKSSKHSSYVNMMIKMIARDKILAKELEVKEIMELKSLSEKKQKEKIEAMRKKATEYYHYRSQKSS
jgi:hypothetical protein